MKNTLHRMSAQISNSGTGTSSTTASDAAGNGNGNTGGGGGMKASENIMRKTTDAIRKAGGQVDFKNKTVTTPDGQTLPFSAGVSPAALSAAGVSGSDLSKMTAALNKADAKAAAIKAGDGVEGDGAIGGPGGSSAGSAETGKGYTPATQAAGPRLGIDRSPAQVAGLTKNFNGEPIGVASDSIFGIIDRRYEFHSRQGSFLAQP